MGTHHIGKLKPLLSIYKCTTVVGSTSWDHRQTTRKGCRIRNKLFCLGKRQKRGVKGWQKEEKRARTQKYCFVLTTKDNLPDAWSSVWIDVRFIGAYKPHCFFLFTICRVGKTLDIFILIVFSLDPWHRGLISVWKTKMEELSPIKSKCPQSNDLGVYSFWVNSYFICFLLIFQRQMI